LSAKVIAALTCALLPLGILTAIITADAFRQIAVESGEASIQRWIGVVLPLVMWLAAVLTCWLVAERLLVRPLTELRRTVERYAGGNTDIRLGNTDFLSQEMTELARAFDRMADEIGRHDAELNEALVEQKRLTREVHHRVKNNLQIVSSLLSIQARETTSADVAHAYSTIQMRVGALALVHRWMYDDETARGVDLRALVTDLCASLEQNLTVSNGSARLRCCVDRFFVSQDTAVPVAFLITELLNLAAQRVAPAVIEATVSAQSDGNHATLTIVSEAFCQGDGPKIGDPSTRIIQGMARQLRSPLNYEPDTGRYSIRIALPPATA